MSVGAPRSEKDIEDFNCELSWRMNCVRIEIEKMQFKENGNLEGRKNVCKIGKASISLHMILCWDVISVGGTTKAIWMTLNMIER